MSEPIREVVRDHYAKAALQVLDTHTGCGCGPSCCGGVDDPIARDLYDSVTASSLPEAAVLASLGCGNPTALAELRPGEVVLDLGSGGGIDVLLSAKRVGPSGKAYGLDMTDEMLALARRNAAEAGATNVEFLRGHIEEIPLPGDTVDVIISNCVINLSGDKREVLAEAFRVLKPGGRFAVSDIVVRGDWSEIPAAVRRSVELWAGCIAGALEEQEFLDLLADVGFEAAAIEPTRIYRAEEARQFLEDAGLDVDAVAAAVDGRFMAAFVRATKPAAVVPVAQARERAAAASAGEGCCAPGCCQ
jgi:SAM-dependent methyltransferase